MSFSLATLWHERNRFLPGVLAVAFSALLIAMQSGLLLGLFSITSIPIDRTNAHIWVGHPNVLSVDVGRPIPEAWLGRLLIHPEVKRAEVYLQGFTYWSKPQGGGAELCCVIGARLDANSLGALRELTDSMRSRLTEPGTVIVDQSEFERLGIDKVGDVAEINAHRVRVVDVVHGLHSLAGPYVFCSVTTARPLLRLLPDQTTYLLVECYQSADVPDLVGRLNDAYGKEMTTISHDDFSVRSRMHWLRKTKAGIALGCAAVLGLLVGAVVTSQTLYAATAASLREYAVLRALGIPRWRMAAVVLVQSFWIGLAGVVVGLVADFCLARIAGLFGVNIPLPWQLLAFAAGVTLVMALLSGLVALRSLRLIEPANLLR
jgi:putative ABC transport system permease protein